VQHGLQEKTEKKRVKKAKRGLVSRKKTKGTKELGKTAARRTKLSQGRKVSLRARGTGEKTPRGRREGRMKKKKSSGAKKPLLQARASSRQKNPQKGRKKKIF